MLGEVAAHVAFSIGELADMPPEHVLETMPLREALGAGTIGLIDLALRLEERFDVEIAECEVAAWVTVGDVARCIERKCPVPDWLSEALS